MANKKRKQKKSPSQKVTKDEDAITWDDIAAMSDSDDEGGNAIELNTKAKNLQLAITKNIGSMLASLNSVKDDDEEFEEDVLDGSSSEEEENDNIEEEVEDNEKVEQGDDDDDDDDNDEEEDGEDEEEKADDDGKETGTSFIDRIKNKAVTDANENSNSDSDSSDDENEEESQIGEKRTKLNMNSKALSVVALELNSVHSKMPWAETFVVVPPTPLPFGDNGDPDSNPLDIHDDLKREVAFYNTALEAALLAQSKLKEAKIPITRPDDFFAEMVKTDEHMASVKDRLIFENKKIEAVAQRKSNKEQKLRAKESHANRLAEKAKRKKDHFKDVEDWANSAAKNRGGGLREDVDDYFLNNRYNGTGPGKKRQNADKKFGFGGKRGRFKQNDARSMNDTSGFNPRGNFPGGMKKTHKKDGSGAGASRAGKRARDAKRSRR